MSTITKEQLIESLQHRISVASEFPESEKAQIDLELARIALASLTAASDERAAFETFMEKRFKDLIDRRLVKNGDGEYFAWDMQVSWIVWQGRAAMLHGSEPVTDNTNNQFESLSRGDK